MIRFAFFGTDEFAVMVLDELQKSGLRPSLVITTSDKPKGRKLLLTPSPVKIWAGKNKIKLGGPENNFDLFIVASYGKIIKKEVLALPKFGALNIHPSLLPKYRGPSPIQTAILNDDEKTGVTIMLVDEEMDHGPILAQETTEIKNKNYLELREELAKLGAKLLAKVTPKWVAGKIKAKPQNHTKATYTQKIKKTGGEVKLIDDPRLNYRKFLAYTPWPGIFFFNGQNRRIKITDAVLENGIFNIKKVVPAGGKETGWEDYKRGFPRVS